MMPARQVPGEAAGLYDEFAHWLASRNVGNHAFFSGARSFLSRFPDPQRFASEPLRARLSESGTVRPVLTFLMLHGYLRPGYDYLLERRLTAIPREAAVSPIGAGIAAFLDAAERMGYAPRSREAMASQVAARLLIETGRPLRELSDDDLAAFEAAISERQARNGRDYAHYRHCLYAASAVIYHLGAPAQMVPKRPALGHWSWERHFEGVSDELRGPMVAYLERCTATLARSTVSATAGELAHFGRFLAVTDPGLASFAGLDRRRHIEPYLSAAAAAVNDRTGLPIAISSQRSRVQAVGRMLGAMTEWGWPDAPGRRLIFDRDSPRLPRPLPRYLPADADRRLVSALEASPSRLRADALLLLRATGLRIGELVDLELDCVHEVPGQGAWLKVPLGKLATERMVPLEDQTVDLIDQIAARRSPGRPLRHPRTGRPADFLLTYQGRRISACSLRGELCRAAGEAGIGPVVPHQLRHTFATELVNAGCSLQALMAMLGHVSAEMSLRYGRLFDATVRADYDRALAQAKEYLGPVLPDTAPAATETSWRAAPLIKTRLSAGYCLRTPEQGTCAYSNICEHCPNFCTEATFLPALHAQRADTAALAADAATRGWEDQAARHRHLAERLDLLIARAESA